MENRDPSPETTGDPPEALTFESALAELEALVERMEDGELSLEQSLACFERGMRLHLFCQKALESADQKVRILTADRGEDDLAPFEPADPR